ncbi:MAG: hypothetical protein IPI93_07690 [Sphingobacteriaceae bacterium]|nr:hypothetical protein [Sphingobacteriaceae bacterium]
MKFLKWILGLKAEGVVGFISMELLSLIKIKTMKIIFSILLFSVVSQINAQCWKSIAGGGLHSIAIKTDGTLWAWGYNGQGEIGDGTLIDKSLPTQISTSTNWQSIAGSYAHSLGLKTKHFVGMGINLWSSGDGTIRVKPFQRKLVLTIIGSSLVVVDITI